MKTGHYSPGPISVRWDDVKMPLANEGERWRKMLSWGGRLLVSDAGRVAVISRGRFQILSPCLSHHGYQYVSIRSKHFTVHRMVCEAFLGHRPHPSIQINHKDGAKLNNALDNLEYVTKEENHNHAKRLMLFRMGTTNNQAKLTEEKVLEARRRHSLGASIKGLATEFGVAKSVMWKILKGRKWRHVQML